MYFLCSFSSMNKLRPRARTDQQQKPICSLFLYTNKHIYIYIHDESCILIKQSLIVPFRRQKHRESIFNVRILIKQKRESTHTKYPRRRPPPRQTNRLGGPNKMLSIPNYVCAVCKVIDIFECDLLYDVDVGDDQAACYIRLFLTYKYKRT